MNQGSNPSDGIRINKYLSNVGVCSRREADRLIDAGKITVDGIVADMGMKVNEYSDICVNGKPIKKDKKFTLIAFNKPRGVVCTTFKGDPDNIVDFLKFDKRIYPIGRLDKDSEGLILLTNQGEIVDKILRGSNMHEKEYVVKVNKKMTQKFIDGMQEGVPILDTVTRPCEITPVDDTTFNIILTQGLNRQIRRMCEYFGYHVVSLKRVRVMNIKLGRLKTGTYRNVTPQELEELKSLL
ncbi:MAG: pseudouridine synthase [bacterium]|nr:pseudouridine synthase [bacterium]